VHDRDAPWSGVVPEDKQAVRHYRPGPRWAVACPAQGESHRYPHYDETIRPHFDRDYGIFLAFLEKNQLGTPHVNQCEVTYVNHILAGKGWERYDDVEKIFTFWRSPDAIPPGPAEDLRLHARFVIPGRDEKPVGRLHVDVQPAVRTRPIYCSITDSVLRKA